MTSLSQLVNEYNHYATQELNQELGLPLGYDQTRGNRCDKLTLGVMRALQAQGMSLRRELHQDDEGNWHYLLTHTDTSAEPSGADLITDLNPWQWREFGGGILHASRDEVMTRLQEEGAPAHFVALRSLSTLTRAHDERPNPFQ